MKHYTNTFMGYTTVVVDIETERDSLLQAITQALNTLGNSCNCEALPKGYYIENRYDEDIVKVWRYTVLTSQNDSCIQSVINDIADLVLETA